MRIFDNPNFDFIRWRWPATALSILIILAGLVTVIVRGGLPLGVDFTGGTVVIVQFAQAVSEDDIRGALGDQAADAVVQRFGAVETNQMMIRLPLEDTGNESIDAVSADVQNRLRGGNLGEFTVINRELVSPTIGGDLRSKAIWATITALGGILAYIAFRFRFSFAVGAVVATFHDILVTLAFLTWFGYDLSLNVVAAILTIAGYSVNDTVVVFDRVRETQRLAKRDGLATVVNRAVNQTLSRTVITAGTTVIAVIALYLFGGDVLSGFAFTMIVGVVAGTYSTVFIASSVAIVLSSRTRTKAPAAQPDGRKRARA
ncbi:MAG: protein-export membrane protein SecF [Acidobacteria bacterium SCN 69-37]|nr:MAG: protein-export membrane protein SecF [Acidobacteria bacterium SCN 69-37]